VYSLWLTPAASAKRRQFEAPMTPNVCRAKRSAEFFGRTSASTRMTRLACYE